ncbi:MAG: hypothetical protein ACI8W8_000882 [Rhodothermales bacterium]|jgi:hypothetical protein
MKTLLIILLLLGLSACRSTTPAKSAKFAAVDLADLSSDRAQFSGRLIAVDGFVLGGEIQEHKHGYRLWIVAIGDSPPVADSANDRLIYPQVTHKIRVLEDGYNASIIARCHELFMRARADSSPVTVMGEFDPREGIQHYQNGIDLHLRSIAAQGVRIDTDFGDQSHLQAASPGMVKRMYGGAKKVLNVVSDAF